MSDTHAFGLVLLAAMASPVIFFGAAYLYERLFAADPWPDFTPVDVIEPAALPLSESEAACRIRAEILASEASRWLRGEAAS